jgi:PTS system nitrogen regulatory IIA component
MAWPFRMAASRASRRHGGGVSAAQPIGFDAPDEMPVGLLIFLLVPEAATQKHLEILSEIAELLSDPACASASRPAPTPRVLHGMIAGWQSTQAA